MGKIVFKPIIEYHDFKFINNLEFKDYYVSIYNYSVGINKPKKKTYTKSHKKYCVFCNKDELAGAKFSNNSHVIPAFYNDPKLFSKEECNDCNHKYGDLYDNDLSKMLNPYLIVTQILPRKGLARKAKNKYSTVEFNKNNGLTIITKADFKINTDVGSLSIPIPRESFNPQKALRSLLHTLYLIIDNDNRRNLYWIVDALNNPVKEIPTGIYWGFNQSEKMEITIEVFRKVKDENRICDYILKMKFGHYFLYYGIYYDTFKPILIEPIAMDESITSPPSLHLTDYRHCIKISSGNQEILLSFEEYSESGSGVVNKVSRRDEYLVSILFGDTEVINKTRIIIFNDGRIELGGHDLLGRFIVSPKEHESKYLLNPNGNSVVTLKKTIDFLLLMNSNKEFTIKSLNGQKKIIIPTSPIKIQHNLIDIIQSLYIISTRLNIYIKFQPSDEPGEINKILWLSTILEKGLDIDNVLKIETTNNESARLIMGKIFDKKNIIISYPQNQLEIMKIKLELSDLLEIVCHEIQSIENENNEIIIHAQAIRIVKKTSGMK